MAKGVVLATLLGALLLPISSGSSAETEPDFLPLNAVGDIGLCGSTAPEAVSSLLDVRDGDIVGLGDLAYPSGSATNFAECFDPAFGRHRDRMLPVVGNHEYLTPEAAGYVGYFGEAAGPEGQFWYAEQRGNWHILVLNSNCSQVGCEEGSAQHLWLEDQLSLAPPGVCRLVAMHHPRWSSYPPYDDYNRLDPLLSAAETAGLDVVLTGHAHHYERFEQQTITQELDTDRGFHHFTVGTGGAVLRPTSTAARHSAVRIQAYGILELSLEPTTFEWAFRSVDDEVLDVGSDACVNGLVPDPDPEPEPDPEPADPQLYRLYRAVFLRAPDTEGMDYWLDRRQSGLPLMAIANFFAASPEFVHTYGELADGLFVERMYLNVLGRPADKGGLAYWRAQLAAGMTRGELVLNFSESPEFVTRVSGS